MTEESPVGVGVESLSIDPNKTVNGAWVPVRDGVEIRVARFSQDAYAAFVKKPENKDLNESDMDRAFFGEVLIREIRGANFDWSPDYGRELLLAKHQITNDLTDQVEEVYLYDPIYRTAVRANNIDALYLKEALGN